MFDLNGLNLYGPEMDLCELSLKVVIKGKLTIFYHVL